MKTIGMIGGMSWESTLEYYRVINQETAAALGGFHSARIALVSVDFAEIEELQHHGDWAAAGAAMAAAATRCEAAGAELVILCTNTMHKTADAITEAISVPFLHIADATARRITSRGLRTVGLLGTRYTMEDGFYRGRLEQAHGLEVLTPDAPDREEVHRVIYEELVHGRILDESRRAFARVMRSLVDRGAGGIIAGCTEIGLLVGESDTTVPLFDTARIHAQEAVREALA